MSLASRCLLAAPLFLLLGQTAGAEPANPGADEIGRLIKQLGSDSFEEREAASLRLAEIGGPALPALGKAAGSQDAEVSRRASALEKLLKARIGAEEARRIIERAVAALGGWKKVSRYRGLMFRGKATTYVNGQGNSVWISEHIYRHPDRSRTTFEPARGEGRAVVTVLNGDKGWLKWGTDQAGELSPPLLDRYRESDHDRAVANLTSLLMDKAYTLSPLEGAKVEGSYVLGVLVSHQDHRPVKLFFDKGAGFLVKYEVLIQEEGREVAEETFLSNHREFHGVHRPGKFVIKRGGEKKCVWEITDHQALEDADDSLFAKP
jgi:hypothetical protein